MKILNIGVFLNMTQVETADAHSDLFQAAINECKARVLDLYSPYRVINLNEIIWHYTSLTGLHGILNTKVLFATNAMYMNDASELHYGRHICEWAFQNIKIGDATMHDWLKMTFNDAKTPYEDCLINRETYVTCFCRTADLLSQWTRYSNSGNGVAIGFRIKDMMDIFREHTWITVDYNIDSQRMVVMDTFVACVTFLNSRPAIDVNIVLASLFSVFHTFITALKHPSFLEEREVWLVIIPNARNCLSSEIKFRNTNNMMVPYLESPADISSAISEIVVGPNVHRELNCHSVKRLLQTLGYSDSINVSCSDTPLR